jgi:hypothetical protein
MSIAFVYIKILRLEIIIRNPERNKTFFFTSGFL